MSIGCSNNQANSQIDLSHSISLITCIYWQLVENLCKELGEIFTCVVSIEVEDDLESKGLRISRAEGLLEFSQVCT
jgi:hypothetical protein